MSKHLYGLIGKSLKHTFSPGYFTEKFKQLELNEHAYTTFEFTDSADIVELKSRPEIKGLNVTIPYKELVMPHLDEIDEDAYQVGAVNTIKIRDGHWTGYNTDVLGFEDMLDSIQEGRPSITQAMILGSGGASKAVQYVCEKRGISYTVISRRGPYNYESITAEMLGSMHLIVNTTPLGMYPNIDAKPNLDYDQLSSQHSCIDLIYNPEKTVFLKESASRGALIKNGYKMLVSQAEHSWTIWNKH